MGLRWDWSDKMGEVIYDERYQNKEHPYKCNLYQGNALMIAVNEFPEGTYSMGWFAADETHLKNMLGITKGHENCMADFGIKTIRLDTKYKSVQKIVGFFAKAKLNINIELYNSESEDVNNA